MKELVESLVLTSEVAFAVLTSECYNLNCYFLSIIVVVNLNYLLVISTHIVSVCMAEVYFFSIIRDLWVTGLLPELVEVCACIYVLAILCRSYSMLWLVYSYLENSNTMRHSMSAESPTVSHNCGSGQFTQREINISPSATDDFGGVWLGDDAGDSSADTSDFGGKIPIVLTA